MKRIYIVRHGSAYDKEWREQASSPLNKPGLKHAEGLADRFKNAKVDAVFCSTMERAKDTCALFLKHHPHVNPAYDDGLREVLDEGYASQHDSLVYFLDRFDKVKDEVMHTFDDVIASIPERAENVFIFSHGHWIRFIVLGLLRASAEGFFNLHVDFASVTIVKIADDGKKELVLFNDCSHTYGTEYGCGWC